MTIHPRLRAWIAVVLLIASMRGPAVAQDCSRPVSRGFKVFNALAYEGQPDMGTYGLRPVHIVDRGIWREGASRKSPPDPRLVREYLDNLPQDGAPIVLDFEDFSFGGGAADARAALVGLDRIIKIFRRSSPNRLLGFYGYLPNRDYWRSLETRDSQNYRAWQAENDLASRLADEVDVLFPSLYTFYPDQVGWITYATAQICEARRLSSKPIYVFLWPDYHGGEDLTVRPIPGHFWRIQLETVHRLADGVVIWGGWDLKANRAQPWDPRASWWRETLAFLKKTPH